MIVFSYNIPRADQSSGERRFVALLELMAEVCEVDLCVARFYGDYLKEEYQKHIPLLKGKGINVLPVKKGIVEEALKGKKYDIGFFEFYWMAEEVFHYFWKYQPKAVTIVDSVDVHFAREETQTRLGLIPKEKVEETKQRELKIYSQADITLAVSREDITLLTDSYGIEHVVFVPNIVPNMTRRPGLREPVALFVGSFLWPPNADAMQWFTTEVWPKVISRFPRGRFQIIGSAPTDDILAMNNLDGVEVLGYVPETTPYLENAAVSVAPVRFGGGMKGKVNEALAHGLPVVTTHIGAQGFGAVNGKEMIITDDPEQFADEIVGLFEQPEKQEEMGLAGQLLNARHCSPDVVRRQIGEMLSLADQIRRAGVKRPQRQHIIFHKISLLFRKFKDMVASRNR